MQETDSEREALGKKTSTRDAAGLLGCAWVGIFATVPITSFFYWLVPSRGGNLAGIPRFLHIGTFTALSAITACIGLFALLASLESKDRTMVSRVCLPFVISLCMLAVGVYLIFAK